MLFKQRQDKLFHFYDTILFLGQNVNYHMVGIQAFNTNYICFCNYPSICTITVFPIFTGFKQTLALVFKISVSAYEFEFTGSFLKLNELYAGYQRQRGSF